MTVLTIHTDGAARGNPGPASFAYILARDGAAPIEEYGTLGTMTNNQAEYTALVRALEHAERLGTKYEIVVRSDSELMVKQMRGEYKVKNEDLRELYETAKETSRAFPSVRFEHIRREQNKRADELCNIALDGESKKKRPAKAAAKTSTPISQGVHEEAIDCLRMIAGEWARSQGKSPPPEMVWDQLWSILEEHGVVRTPK